MRDETEVVKKLEAEMRQKKKEMESILKDLQAKAKSFKGLAVEGIEAKLQAVKEMQTEILQKRVGLETALKGIQKEIQSLKELKAKAQKEDIRPAIKALKTRMKEKKRSLEKAIKEMEDLKDKYMKKFFG